MSATNTEELLRRMAQHEQTRRQEEAEWAAREREEQAADTRLRSALEVARNFPTPIFDAFGQPCHPNNLPPNARHQVAPAEDLRWGEWANAYLAAGRELKAHRLDERLEDLGPGWL